MIFYAPPKQPNEQLAYGVDAKNQLASGETIASVGTTVSAIRLDTGADVTSTFLTLPPTIAGSIVSVLVKDGVDKVDYHVTFTIMTNLSHQIEADVIIAVRDD